MECICSSHLVPVPRTRGGGPPYRQQVSCLLCLFTVSSLFFVSLISFISAVSFVCLLCLFCLSPLSLLAVSFVSSVSFVSFVICASEGPPPLPSRCPQPPLGSARGPLGAPLVSACRCDSALGAYVCLLCLCVLLLQLLLLLLLLLLLQV